MPARMATIIAEFIGRSAPATCPASGQWRPGLLEWMPMRPRRGALPALTMMKPSTARLRHIRTVSAGALLSIACQIALADNPMDDPMAGVRVPDGTTKITQTREQNAVTSVRVQRGSSVYHVTPTEQMPYYQQGGRAATWEIFQFNSAPTQDRNAPPPPTR